MKETVESTRKEVGPDPEHNSALLFHPAQAADCSILNITDIVGMQTQETTDVAEKATAPIREQNMYWLLNRISALPPPQYRGQTME